MARCLPAHRLSPIVLHVPRCARRWSRKIVNVAGVCCIAHIDSHAVDDSVLNVDVTIDHHVLWQGRCRWRSACWSIRTCRRGICRSWVKPARAVAVWCWGCAGRARCGLPQSMRIADCVSPILSKMAVGIEPQVATVIWCLPVNVSEARPCATRLS